jgi:maltooligosyltrehalose trehalohydrolase
VSKFHFVKSWGAEKLADDRWRFRLWAPSLKKLELVLNDERRGMDKSPDGWFEIEASAAPGSSYAFAPPDGPVVPDPAARAQMSDVHGASKLVDPEAYEWKTAWKGRPWHETVLYELHIGTFSEAGDFDGVRAKLDHLAKAGITAVELCPVAHFAGTRGWGYDGVLLYAPHPAYGGIEGLKRLVDAAHERGLMVFLDVVYNHFGPDGNYLHAYVEEFFDSNRHTPWGAAIAFEKDAIRRFFIENSLYWLEEYRIDGLRLDAVDHIIDPSDEEVLAAIASAVRRHGFDRPVHLTTEDSRNITWLHERDARNRPIYYDGEWNDDFHHVAHVLATGESDGYYADYKDDPVGDIATALSGGYVYQGRRSVYFDGKERGVPSAHLPPTAFVNFLQNHDQTGNRAFGERLTTLASPDAVRVLTALLMLSPTIPLWFMGEEWGETRPFQFFCDFHGDLAKAVRDGRRREFAAWKQFVDPAIRDTIPDPNAVETFMRSKLDWSARGSSRGKKTLELFSELATIRKEAIVPRLAAMRSMNAEADKIGSRGLQAHWTLGDGAVLRMLANLGGAPFEATLPGDELYRDGATSADQWSLLVTMEAA